MSRQFLPVILLAVLIAVLGYGYFSERKAPPALAPPEEEEADTTHAIVDGTLTFSEPAHFGIATDAGQILSESYIPPCDQHFDYCVYYNSTKYSATNFDTAGIRIKERDDATSTEECLEAPPEGYAEFIPEIQEREGYRISIFAPLNNAGAGHYSEGVLYRLAYDGRCVEFETRIGESQFANYAEGSIVEFTETDRKELQHELDGFMRNVRFGAKADEPIFTQE